jgi:hypothetical protein
MEIWCGIAILKWLFVHESILCLSIIKSEHGLVFCNGHRAQGSLAKIGAPRSIVAVRICEQDQQNRNHATILERPLLFLLVLGIRRPLDRVQ